MGILGFIKGESGSKTKGAAKAKKNLKEKVKCVLNRGGSSEKIFARKRIERELKCANNDPPSHCSYGVVRHDNDIFRWEGAIMGPSASPYEGGVFFLSILFPPDYPFQPPSIKFLTKVFHPNISEDGNIHIDILGKAWTPALRIENLLLSICSILAEPVEKCYRRPLWNLYKSNRNAYNLKAREWTQKYALGLN